jgi:hypothetical protein
VPAVIVASTIVGVGAFPPATDTVEAASANYFSDSDNDLLPDSIEWALMSDPACADTDRDGTDDFLDAVQFQLPGVTQQPPLDNELRAVVSHLTLPNGTQHVMLNLLFRIVSGAESEVKWLQPFVQVPGGTVSIAPLFASNILHIAARFHPARGMYLLICSRLTVGETIFSILPMAVGVRGIIGQRLFSNGCLLADVDRQITTIAPVSSQHYVLHPISTSFAGQGGTQPQQAFWASSQVCLLELEPTGGGGIGQSVVCTVSDAYCGGAPTLLCAPSCPTENGKVYVLPDGLSFLNGR